MKLDPISTTGVHVRQGAKSFSPFVQGGVDIGAVAQRGRVSARWEVPAD